MFFQIFNEPEPKGILPTYQSKTKSLKSWVRYYSKMDLQVHLKGNRIAINYKKVYQDSRRVPSVSSTIINHSAFGQYRGALVEDGVTTERGLRRL